MLKPNFFIVGAPKCGTSAMYDYLKPHPEIFMPAYKEPHFFARDFQGSRFERFRKEEDYLALFAQATTEKRVGEASVWYLYSHCAAQEIKDYAPDAQIIIMLRSPVDMIYSLYHQLLYTLCEDIPVFEEALAAEPDRKQGRRMPPGLHIMPESLYYHDTAGFTEQVKRYFDVFGRDRVHVIIYDDFKADTPKVYRETLEFLGVNPDFVPDIEIVNPNKYSRNPGLQRFLMEPPSWLMAVGKKVLPVARPIYWKLRKINTNYQPRPSLDPAVKAQLQREFLPEVEQLSKLLGRDLTYWCKS